MNDWKKDLAQVRSNMESNDTTVRHNANKAPKDSATVFKHATILPKPRHYVIEEHNPDSNIDTFLNKQIGKVNPVFVIASHTVEEIIARVNTYCFLDYFDDTHPVIVVTTNRTHGKQELADLDAFLTPNAVIWDLGIDEQSTLTKIVTTSFFNLCEPCTAPVITVMEDRLAFFFDDGDVLNELRDNNNTIMTILGRTNTDVARYKEATFSEMINYVEACLVCSDATALTLGDTGDVSAISDMLYTPCNGFVTLDVRKARWGTATTRLLPTDKRAGRAYMCVEGNPAFTTFSIANALLHNIVGTITRYRVNRYEPIGLHPVPNKTVASCVVDDVFDWGAFNAKLTR